MGDYWDESAIRNNKQDVLKSGARISKLFSIAYSQLAEARVIKKELDSYYQEAINNAQVNGVIHEIAKSIITDAKIQFAFEPKDRHLFATAFTPQGHANHYDTILQDVEKLYLISGDASAIGSEVVGAIADALHIHGLDTEVYHCAMEPEEIDLVIVPSMKIAVIKSIPGVNFKPQDIKGIQNVKVFNLNAFLDQDVISVYDKEIRCCNERLNSALCRAISYIAAAKTEHDVLESYYIPAMHFDDINAKRDEILQRFLKYAEELK